MPFSFPGWSYDVEDLGSNLSQDPIYPHAIYNLASTAVINVNNANGIALCKVAASGFTSATTPTFHGNILGGGTVTSNTSALPIYNSYADVTFDLTWQPLSAITINSLGGDFSVEIWEISYVLL